LQPSDTSVSTRCDPINPAPPVTNALLNASFISTSLFYNGPLAAGNYQIDFALLGQIRSCLKNSRSRSPLESGISRLDYSKLMCSSKQGAKSIWPSLNRFDEHLNIHKKRCEILPIPAGQHSPWALDAFLR
jgi:hypothetical protein